MARAEASIVAGPGGGSGARSLRGETGRALIVALGLAGAVIAAKALFMRGVATDTSFLLYFPGIALSAWYGGTWPGVLTTVVTGAADLALFQASPGPQVVDPADQLRLILYVIAGGIVSGLTGLLRTARACARRPAPRRRHASMHSRSRSVWMRCERSRMR